MENKELSVVYSQLSIDPICQDLLSRISEVYRAGSKGAKPSHKFGFAKCEIAVKRVRTDWADGGRE
jgi:hypothetical protein